MKLYHYADKPFTELLTRHKQGNVTSEDYNKAVKLAKEESRPGTYYDHVSFFFEPIPLKEIGKIFKGTDHRVWREGNTLYEHIVDSNNLPKDMIYQVAETPSLREFWKDLSPKDMTDSEWDNALKEVKRLQTKNGELGTSLSALVRVGELIGRDILGYYKKSRESDRWEGNKKKYAADVPHVMIYSKTGVFPVSEINKVIVGSEKRERVNGHPLITRW